MARWLREAGKRTTSFHAKATMDLRIAIAEPSEGILEISLREIFGAVRFSTFSTQSKRTRP